MILTVKNPKYFFSGVADFLNHRHQNSTESYLSDQDGQPSYDLTELYQLAEGNPVYTSQLLELFLENTEQGLIDLQVACKGKHWDQASGKAHKLIPGCKHLHLNQLVGVLQQIELLSDTAAASKSIDLLATQALASFLQVKALMLQELNELKKIRFTN